MFRNLWMLFETTEGGAGGGGGEPEPTPAAEPAAPTGDDGGTDGDYVSSEQFNQLNERLGPLLDLVENLPGGVQPGVYQPDGFQQGPPQADQPGFEQDPMPDPGVYPHEFQQWQERQFDQRIEAVRREYEPSLRETHSRQAEQQLDQALGALPDEARYLGLPDEHHERAEEAIEHLTAAFLPVDLAEQVAGLQPQMAERVIEQQLSQAASSASSYLGELLELARAQGRDDYRSSLGGNGEPRQPVEPPVAGSGIEGVAPAGSYEEIINRHLGSTPA